MLLSDKQWMPHMISRDDPSGVSDVKPRVIECLLELIHFSMLPALFIKGLFPPLLLVVDEFSKVFDDAIDLFVVFGAFLVCNMLLNVMQSL